MKRRAYRKKNLPHILPANSAPANRLTFDLGQARTELRSLREQLVTARTAKAELARARALMADIFYALSEPAENPPGSLPTGSPLS